MALRLAKWTIDSRMRDGQEVLGQYVITSSCGGSTCEPQLGQRSGILYGFSNPVPRSFTGPRICGMTSPARVPSTQSPSRISFAAIRPALCSVAFETGTPPISTGALNPYAVLEPVEIGGSRAAS